MSAKYFIQKDGQTAGPLSASDLKNLAQSGRLLPTDLVWKEGSERKVRGNQVKGLSFKNPEVVPSSSTQNDGPSPVKDNVPLVENEPNNSSDQCAFHYEMDGESQGAVSFSELQGLVQQGVITRETQVWHDGLDDWTPAADIHGLAASFPVAKKAPPPLKESLSSINEALPSVTAGPAQAIGVKSGSREDLKNVAKYQKGIILCLLIGLIQYCTIICGASIVPTELLGIVALLTIVNAILSTVFVILLTQKVYNTGICVLFGVMAFIPCLSLIGLLVVNSKATGILKKNGIKVGLFGANLSQI